MSKKDVKDVPIGDVTIKVSGETDPATGEWHGQGQASSISWTDIATWASAFDVTIPESLKTININAVFLDLKIPQTGPSHYYLSVTLGFSVGGAPAALLIGLEYTDKKAASGEFSVTAQLVLDLPDDRLVFTGELRKSGEGLALSCIWRAAQEDQDGGGGVSLTSILQALHITDVTTTDLPELPDFTGVSLFYDTTTVGWSLAMGLTTSACSIHLASVVSTALAVDVVAADVVRPGSGGGRVTVLVVQLDVGSVLAALPVVGAQIPSTVADVPRLVAMALAGAPVRDRPAQAALAALLGNAGADLPPMPAQVWVSSFCVGAIVEMGGTKRLVVVPGKAARGDTPSVVTTAAVGEGPGLAVWYELDKALGPVRLSRVGVAYGERTVWLLLDGVLTVGGITLEVMGLGVGVGTDPPYRVRGALDGLGIAYHEGPVEIVGAVLRQSPPENYDLLLVGGLVVSTTQISIAAVGAYAHRKDGMISVFVFGEIDGLRVGEPPVQVQGLAGGFGYNSTVIVPSVERVAEFPMVAGLTNPDMFPVDKGPVEVLDALIEVIRPAPGEIWLAAGVHARCFEFIDVRVLLILQVGEDFALTILGLASASFPKTEDAGGPTYARVTLQVRASYRASTGELAVLGQLTRDSYLLDPQCHLEGGFALCTWVPPSPYQGDFVVSVGGYHPAYHKPEHYPVVPRIGFQWALGGDLSIRGECYAALTPAAFMLGAKLDVDFHASVVHAWLHAELNALIQWEPFFFEVDIGVRAGAELHILFSPRVELGVDLRVWGPPTGGIATFHLPIVGDVSVRFGQPKPADPRRLEWEEFHERVLTGQPVEVLATAGVLPEPPPPSAMVAGAGGDQLTVKPWLVSAAGFSFISQAPTPVSTVELMTPDGSHPVTLPDREPFSIRPMGTSPVTATHTVQLSKVPAEPGAGREVVVDLVGGEDPWAVLPVYQDVPLSLWGANLDSPSSRPATDQELLGGQVIGVKLRVPGPREGPTPGPISEKVLNVDPIPLSPPPVYVLSAEPEGPAPGRPGTVRAAIVDGLAGTAPARVALDTALRGLGVAPLESLAGPLTDDAERVWSYLPHDPMIVAADAVMPV